MLIIKVKDIPALNKIMQGSDLSNFQIDELEEIPENIHLKLIKETKSGSRINSSPN